MKTKFRSNAVLVASLAAAVAGAFAPAAGSAPAPYYELELGADTVRFAQASFAGSTVVLRDGKGSGALLEWAISSKRSDVVMYHYEGTAVARYNFFEAWPSKIEIGSLKAGSSEVLYEVVTLTVEDTQRVAP